MIVRESLARNALENGRDAERSLYRFSTGVANVTNAPGYRQNSCPLSPHFESINRAHPALKTFTIGRGPGGAERTNFPGQFGSTFGRHQRPIYPLVIRTFRVQIG
jgi:hypothetical protein